MSFEPVEWEPDDYSETAPAAAPEPDVSGPVLRKRPIPDQLDHFSTKLAGLLDRELDREMLITIGAAVVNLGAIAAQLRKQPLPSITDGISDAEAEASATFDLTIDEVRALKADRDAAVAECARVTKRAEFLDDALNGVRQQAIEAVKARNAVEVQLAEASSDGAQWQERAKEAEALKRAAYADRSAAIERADEAERELAELRERMIGNGWRQEWGVQHPLLGTEYVQGSENARYLCRTRNEEHPGYEWRVVRRLTGEWKAADDV